MDQPHDETPLAGVDREVKELLGLFDTPAYARRGLDVDLAIARVDTRCRRERGPMLDMVRLRLRQWAALAEGPETALDVFTGPIDALWPACDAPPPTWSSRDVPPRRLRATARDLIASVDRFNRRWTAFLGSIPFEQVNRLIDAYNRYYLLEKECALGSARLASRFFVAKRPVSVASLVETYPPLPRPDLRP